MIRRPARNITRGTKTFTARIPSMTGGWNARDPISGMPAEDAIELQNYFPQPGWVELRKGYDKHASGFLASTVDTLFSYNAGSTEELLCAINGSIYEITTATTSPSAALATGYSSDKWQYVNFKSRIFAVNGVDTPAVYNGTTWADTTWSGSGLTTSDLIHVNIFKSRLFYVESGTASFWYAPVDSVTGTLTEFDLSVIAPSGGELIAMGTWTRDGGDGVDDLAVFLMARGDVIVYQGDDPGDATAWLLVGEFKVAEPIGRRCLQKFGSDLIAITQDGVISLSRSLPLNQVTTKGNMSDKINGAIVDATRDFKDTFGWDIQFYPKGNMLLFNVPARNSKFHQYVMNTITGAWSKFTGINARCWAVSQTNLFFGSELQDDKGGPAWDVAEWDVNQWGLGQQPGIVFKADIGTDDDGSAIDGKIKTSFRRYYASTPTKRYTMIQPLINTSATTDVMIGFDVDYASGSGTYSPVTVSSSGPSWDVAFWDQEYWGEGDGVISAWRTVRGVGDAAAVRLKTSTKNSEIKVNGINIQFEIGSGFT